VSGAALSGAAFCLERVHAGAGVGVLPTLNAHLPSLEHDG